MPESYRGPRDLQAAGVVAWRPGRQVLLVHRPKYDDWSFPKGKLDPGEHPVTTAVREAAEETGLHVRLGLPLPDQRYPVGRGVKRVRYWTARVVGDDDVASYPVNDEVDEVAWLPSDEARTRLTYARDVATLDEATRRRGRTVPLVVVRHGVARSRQAWRRDDRERPLVQRGHLQAQLLVPLLAAYDVARVVTSSSARCRQTVQPYAETAGLDLEGTPWLSEEDATDQRVARTVHDATAAARAGSRGVALCSHRTVLPAVFDALGLADPGLEKGEVCVAHLRKGRVVGIERHRVA